MTKRDKKDRATNITKTARMERLAKKSLTRRWFLEEPAIKAFAEHYTTLGIAITIAVAATWGRGQPAPDSLVMKIPFYAGLVALLCLAAYLICSNELNLGRKAKAREIPKVTWLVHVSGLSTTMAFLLQHAMK